ncbi:MAG TPA: AAA family ATPase, partial [Trueperaceae bacterium]|nr:AAA family ATPase [Trueperaceae bacterium]
MPQAHALLVAPTGPGVGLTSVSLGIVRALERRGLKVGFVKPIRQPGADDGLERSSEFIRRTTTIRPGESLAFSDAEALLSTGKRSELLQAVVGRYRHAAQGADVVIVEGLAATADHPGLDTLNGQMAKAIDAEVVLVTSLGESLPGFIDRLTLAAETFGGSRDPKVLGAVVNKLNAPRMDVIGTTRTALKRPDVTHDAASIRAAAGVFTQQFQLLGAVPFDPIMVSPRTFDVAQHLGATVLSQGELMTRRVVDVSLVARTVANMTHRLRAGALLITPADRDDVILAVSMAAMNGTPLAGLVLTGDLEPSPQVMRLCAKAFATGLPLMSVPTDSYVTAARSAAMNLEVPVDDVARIEKVMERVAEHLEVDGLVARVLVEREPRLSPPAFLHSLVEGARASG